MRERDNVRRRAYHCAFRPLPLAPAVDFHVWWDRVIHWDLPRDPVDFEQREGRIARYGSICVRRALAEAYGRSELAPCRPQDPAQTVRKLRDTFSAASFSRPTAAQSG
jgi:hypothetical protein